MVVYADARQTGQSASLRCLLSACGTFEQFYARFQLLLTPTAPTVPQPSCTTEFLAEEDGRDLRQTSEVIPLGSLPGSTGGSRRQRLGSAQGAPGKSDIAGAGSMLSGTDRPRLDCPTG